MLKERFKQWVYRRDNPRGMLGEQVGYYAGKPIESVVDCFHKITLKHFSVFYEFTGTTNRTFLTNQSARTILVILQILINPLYNNNVPEFIESNL